jgi:hypothetical protein
MDAPHINAPLTAEEFASLREYAKGSSAKAIPPEHVNRLTYFGFVKEGLGAPMLTDAGRLRLSKGL